MKRMGKNALIFIILLLASTVHAQFVTVDSFTVTPTGLDSGDFSYTITNTVSLILDVRVACEPPGGGEVYIRVESLGPTATFSDSFSIASGLNDGNVYTLRVKDYTTGVEIVTATVTFVAPVTPEASITSFTITATGADAADFNYAIQNTGTVDVKINLEIENPSGGTLVSKGVISPITPGGTYTGSYSGSGLAEGDYTLSVYNQDTGTELATATATFSAPICTGEITSFTATSDGSDLSVVVNFENTGSVDCEFRVSLVNGSSYEVDKEPDTYWGDFNPGATGSYTVSGSLNKFGDSTYNIELKDQAIGVVDTETGTVPGTSTSTSTTVPGTSTSTSTIPVSACQGPPSDYLGRFECLVTILLCLLMYLTAPVALFMLVLGGIRFLSDDPPKRKEGKRVIMLAIGGAVMVMVLLGVASLVAGIDLGMCWVTPGPPPSCTDTDGDGYGNPASAECTHPELDCDDGNDAVNPGATESCTGGVDDDCDGSTDCSDTDCEGDAACNQPPTANAGPDQTVTKDVAFTIDGSASSDPDGDSLTYEWTWVNMFGQGVDVVVANTAIKSLATDVLGIHTLRLEVDDGKGGTDTDTVNITVEEAAAWECTETAGPNKDLCYGVKADDSEAACTIGDFKELLIHKNKIQICSSKEESWLNENVFGDPDNGDTALNGVKAANYDAAVQLIWNKLDALYDSGAGECSDDGSTTPDEILDGACGNCVSWSNTLFGLIRSVGVGPDRVKKLGLFTPISSHAVTAYKVDEDEWFILDMTECNIVVKAALYDSTCSALKCVSTLDITADDVAPQVWLEPSFSGGESMFGGFCEGKKFLLFSNTLNAAILSPSDGQEFDEADTVSFEQGTLTTDPKHGCFWSVSCLFGTQVTMEKNNCDVFQKIAGDLEYIICLAYDVELILMDASTNPTGVGCSTIEIDID